MARQQEIGKKGEDLARQCLERKGYKILEQNWRYSKSEIDLIAFDGPTLVFIEVKTRSYDFYGPPQDFVTEKKKKLLTIAASAYMQKNHHDWEIRFDVIAIIFESPEKYKMKHFEDAFFLGL